MQVPALFTTSETGTTLVVNPLLEARTVIEAVPVGVEALVTIVNSDVAEPFAGGVTVVGLKPVPGST